MAQEEVRKVIERRTTKKERRGIKRALKIA